ncbi:MAG TPA: FAD-dependent oxidoreductase [Chloroflexota bacterium]|nr:FAD-dependent oxidoreductase [Chloroflexota bacterium]
MHPDRTRRQADLVVVGSGVAGLSAALAAAGAGAEVLLLTAGAPLSGSSPWAQGGIAAALGADDTPALHEADTLAVGGGLNDARAVHVLVTVGKRAVEELLAAGVPFDGGPAHPDLGLEAGHRRRRIIHANGAATGHAVTAALLAQAAAHARIVIQPYTPAEQLLCDGPRVTGVRSGTASYHGRAVILATGGYASLFARTTNAPESRGQGLALAWQVGATLADLEFVQFHPTALAVAGQRAFLLSEALRGEGALLVDEDGNRVVDALLPRDQVARAVARHGRDHGPVYLTLRHLDPRFVRGHFATLAAQLAQWDIDLARDLLPVAPAAHYCMGGVRTDEMGRSDVPGLYVAGEAACTGVQGANRLASNSLLECLVFGRLAARAALADRSPAFAGWAAEELPARERSAAMAGAGARLDLSSAPAIGAALDRYLGVERDATGLRTLLAAIGEPAADDLLVPQLAARSALLRRESRGAHFRTDYPGAAPEWQGRILWRRHEPPRYERIH